MSTDAIGIDFGTTNSSVARANGAGEIELARFPHAGGVTEAYRSLLYLDKVKDRGASRIKSWSGPAAIEEYLAAETKGRLVQSLKSFLTSRSLKTTDVFGRRVSLEELIARILRDLREKAEAQFGAPIHTAVVGRPVRFVGAEKAEKSPNRARDSNEPSSGARGGTTGGLVSGLPYIPRKATHLQPSAPCCTLESGGGVRQPPLSQRPMTPTAGNCCRSARTRSVPLQQQI